MSADRTSGSPRPASTPLPRTDAPTPGLRVTAPCFGARLAGNRRPAGDGRPASPPATRGPTVRAAAPKRGRFGVGAPRRRRRPADREPRCRGRWAGGRRLRHPADGVVVSAGNQDLGPCPNRAQPPNQRGSRSVPGWTRAGSRPRDAGPVPRVSPRMTVALAADHHRRSHRGGRAVHPAGSSTTTPSSVHPPSPTVAVSKEPRRFRRSRPAGRDTSGHRSWIFPRQPFPGDARRHRTPMGTFPDQPRTVPGRFAGGGAAGGTGFRSSPPARSERDHSTR